jgi:hypothetical protein
MGRLSGIHAGGVELTAARYIQSCHGSLEYRQNDFTRLQNGHSAHCRRIVLGMEQIGYMMPVDPMG